MNDLPETAPFKDGRNYRMRAEREVAQAEPSFNRIEQLFQELDRRFVRVSSRITLDGFVLAPDFDLFETHTELFEVSEEGIEHRRRRLGLLRNASVLTLPQAIRWAVMTHIPEGLLGAVLESLNLETGTEAMP